MSNIAKVVEGAKSFACSLYKSQPGALIPNPISDGLHFAWDSLCGDDEDPVTLPPPPAPPFSGGQCPVFYEVSFQITDPRNPSRPSQLVQLRGDIAGAESRYQYTPAAGYTFQLGILARDSSNNRIFSQQAGGNESTAEMQKRWTIRILSVRRLDGQPDNCGSLPSTFPPAPPPPPGGYTSPPVNITYNDGSNHTAIFNITPPLGDGGPPPDICLNVGLGNSNFSVCFPVGKPPEIVPPGGDIGDVLKNIQDNINELNDSVGDLEDKIDDFKLEFDKFTDPPPPQDDPDLDEKDLPDDNGGEDEDTPGLRWVVVKLLELPDKAQFGTPNVYYAGWITFIVDGAYTVRESINFETSVFKAPEGSTGYAVTFTNKARGSATAYIQKQQSGG